MVWYPDDYWLVGILKMMPKTILKALCGENVVYILRGWPGLGRSMQGICLANILKNTTPNQRQTFYSSDRGYDYLTGNDYCVKYISTRETQPSILGPLGNQTIYSLLEDIVSKPPSAIVMDGELNLLPVVRGSYDGPILALSNAYDLFNPYHPDGLRGVFLSYYYHCNHILIGAFGNRKKELPLPEKFPQLTWATPFVRPDFLDKHDMDPEHKNGIHVAVVLGGGHSGFKSLKIVNENIIQSILEVAMIWKDVSFTIFGIDEEGFRDISLDNITIGSMKDCGKGILSAHMIIARSGRNIITEILTLKKTAILIASQSGTNQTDHFRSIEQSSNVRFATDIADNIVAWNGEDTVQLIESFKLLLSSSVGEYDWNPGNDFLIEKLEQLDNIIHAAQ